MKTNLIKIFIFFVFLTINSIVIGQQDDPDAWENYHNSIQPPEKVMDAIGIKLGMIVGEVGAGRGRYAVHMAKRVGDTGKVYANDIDENKVDYLDYRCKRDTIKNVTTILGSLTDPKFPKAKLDVVYLINTYHHLEDPVGIMKNILPGLESNGILAIIEHDPEKTTNMGSHTTPKNELIKQASDAGFTLVRIETFLKKDNIYIFKPI